MNKDLETLEGKLESFNDQILISKVIHYLKDREKEEGGSVLFLTSILALMTLIMPFARYNC